MNRIKELREKKGLSLRELSTKVGIPASTLGSYEQTGTGARNPKKTNLKILADYFGVTMSYLQGDSEYSGAPNLFNFVEYANNKDSEKMNTELGMLARDVNLSDFLTLYRTMMKLSNRNDNANIVFEEIEKKLNDVDNDISELNSIIVYVIRLFNLLALEWTGDELAKHKAFFAKRFLDDLSLGFDDYLREKHN